MTGKDLEFYENESVPDEEMQEFIDEEIAHVPQAPGELAERLQDNNAASPADSGGDIDANWEEVNDSGGESVFGHNPTPDQSDVEQNAHAMGLDYQDNEPLDLLEKIEKRDRNRYELEEDSKSSNDTI
ncbi:MAG: DUF6335 family protein [Pyrinomonadaceae bacterium]|nr:hypothetical protein [Blastocatellia bacterium]MDQ3220714.1 DUF6335 family protein [Acidobacteriota bacterium]MDQ3490813.1 DUF6335 family protein [Acidobacteriota bacterium]